eukprot:GHVU01130950.1.p1 GENE.GHVU01130950.1~~GHVU01130950.1.p1  ORF type:complete len:136 (-),score=16.64 GHVU01130950.1:78-485(-)
MTEREQLSAVEQLSRRQSRPTRPTSGVAYEVIGDDDDDVYDPYPLLLLVGGVGHTHTVAHPPTMAHKQTDREGRQAGRRIDGQRERSRHAPPYGQMSSAADHRQTGQNETRASNSEQRTSTHRRLTHSPIHSFIH